MRTILARISVGIIFLFTGCQVPSRAVLEGPGGRNSYNEALQITNSEQMLLNLVRLRYYDIPYFLDVGSVTTSFIMKSALNPTFPIPGFNNKNPATLGGELSWQNQPTITYNPLEGQAFANQLLQPIDLRTIQQLCYSGWNVSLVFRLIIQSFDDLSNAPESSGPMPENVPLHKDFYQATDLLNYFQKRGELQIGVNMNNHQEKKRKRRRNSDNNDVEVENSHSLQLAFPAESKESKELAKLLPGSRRVRGRYILNMDLGFNEKGQIGVMPRSIMSCMYYLAQGVQVPKNDLKHGCVAITTGEEEEIVEWEKELDLLLDVRCSSNNPKDAFVKVRYRDYWFFIRDCDLRSKKTFLLLLQLYNLQGGATKQSAPVLTLPVGIG